MLLLKRLIVDFALSPRQPRFSQIKYLQTVIMEQGNLDIINICIFYAPITVNFSVLYTAGYAIYFQN